MSDEQKPYAWAKLNAYGFVLAGLGVLAGTDLIHPANTDLARLTGEVPPGQVWWTLAVVVAGLLLLLGFMRVDRIAETLGLALLTGAVAAQTVVAYALLGWNDYTLTRIAIVTILAGCTWARVSVLWSRDGLAVTIPARDVHRRGGRR